MSISKREADGLLSLILVGLWCAIAVAFLVNMAVTDYRAKEAERLRTEPAGLSAERAWLEYQDGRRACDEDEALGDKSGNYALGWADCARMRKTVPATGVQ